MTGEMVLDVEVSAYGDRLYPLSTSVAARRGFVINAIQIAHHHFVEEKEY